jgi:hypothetical protein
MRATTIRPVSPISGAATLLSMHVDGEPCAVRATPVWPIADVLGMEDAFDGLVDAAVDLDETVIVDAIESRMIAAPRMRRRQRAVSSRAVFYAGR